MTIPRTVDDATEFLRGITFKPDQLVEPKIASSVVCMRTKNVQKELDQTDLIAVPRELVRDERKLLKEGDILLSTANSWDLVGKCTYVPKLDYPATAGGFISVVRPKQRVTDARFLYHWLNSPRMQHTLRHLGRQTTNISNMDVSRFKELDFPEVEFEEQRRISAILDKADAIRRKREQALALADDLLKSAFLEIFGDPLLNPHGYQEVPLGDIADITSGLTKGRRLRDDQVVEALPYMRVANVQDGFLDLSEIKEIEATQEEIEKYLLLDGDLLLTEGGDPDKLGRGCVWRNEIARCIHQNHIFRARLKDERILPDVLSRQLSSRRGKVYFLREAKQTTGIATINKRQLSAYPVLLPPVLAQKRFSEIQLQVSAHFASALSGIEEAHCLFASLSQRAFRGEL